MTIDVPAQPVWHTIPPICIAYIPAGKRVPKDLRGCIIRHAKPAVTG